MALFGGTKARRPVTAALVAAGVVLAGAVAALSLARFEIGPGAAAAFAERAGLADFSASSVTLKVLPSPEISVKGASFSAGRAGVRVKEARVRLSLAYLAVGKAVVKELEAAATEVSIDASAQAGPAFRPFSFWDVAGPLDEALIKDGSFKLTDSGRVLHELTGVAALVGGAPDGRLFRAEAASRPGARIVINGLIDGLGKGLKGTIRVEGLDLASLAPPAPPAPPALRPAPAAAPRLSGKARLEADFTVAGEDGRWRGRIEYTDAVVSHPALGRPIDSPAGALPFEVETSSWRLKSAAIKDAAVMIDDFALMGGAALAAAGGADYDFTASVKSPPIAAVAITDFLKARSIALPFKPARPTGGVVTLEGLTLSGRAALDADGPRLTLDEDAARGAVRLDSVLVDYSGGAGKDGARGLKASGLVRLEGRAVVIDGLTARFNGVEIERIDGRIASLKKGAAYEARVKGSIDAAVALGEAREFLRAAEFDGAGRVSGMLKDASASGRARFSVGVAGAFGAAGPPAFSGVVAAEGLSIGHPSLPFTASSVTGSIYLDNEKLLFKDLYFEDGSSSFRLDGAVTGYMAPGEEGPFLDVAASAELTRPTLMRFAQSSPIGAVNFSGRVPVRGRVHGRRGALIADAFIDLTGADLEYRPLIKKPAGGRMTVTGAAWLKGKELMLEGVNVAFGSSSVALSGRLSLDRNAYAARVSSESLRLADIDGLTPSLLQAGDSGGSLSFDLAVMREGGARPSIDGTLAVLGARFNSPLLPSPVENLDAFLWMSPDGAVAVVKDLRAGRTELSAWMEATDISTGEVRFEVTSPSFYAEDLFRRRRGGALPLDTGLLKSISSAVLRLSEEPEAPGPSGQKRPVQPLMTGDGSVHITEGSVFGHRVEELSFKVRIDEESISVSPSAFYLDRGLARAEATFFRHPASPLLFDARLGVAGADLNAIFSAFGARSRIMTGRVDGELKVSCRRGASPPAACLNGTASIRSERGKLWKFIGVSKLFSIVNIVSIDELFEEGLPYKTLTGDIKITNGVASTENLRLDGASMRMSAGGAIDLPGSRIDAFLAMHPLVTLDKILTNIPLAGYVIGGEEKSTVSMVYEIRGPLSRPEAVSIPLKSLGEGIAGVIERLVKSPAELLKKLEKGVGGEASPPSPAAPGAPAAPPPSSPRPPTRPGALAPSEPSGVIPLTEKNL